MYGNLPYILNEVKIMNLQQISHSDNSPKRERLEFRITKKQKLLFQQAANIQGRSLSDFLASSAEKAASEILKENKILQLSVEDSLSFAKTFLNASKPNSRLKSAYVRYKKDVSSL
jgi:uncharacterized protein (DUF1778 family)